MTNSKQFLDEINEAVLYGDIQDKNVMLRRAAIQIRAQNILLNEYISVIKNTDEQLKKLLAMDKNHAI